MLNVASRLDSKLKLEWNMAQCYNMVHHNCYTLSSATPPHLFNGVIKEGVADSCTPQLTHPLVCCVAKGCVTPSHTQGILWCILYTCFILYSYSYMHQYRNR